MRNIKNRTLCVMLTLSLLLLIHGTTMAQEEQTKRRIGVTLASEKAAYQKNLEEALIRTQGNDDSFELEIQYADWDVLKQEEQIRGYLKEGMDAVILCPVNAKSFRNVLKEAKDLQIPVIDLNMKLDTISSEYIATYVGASMSEEASLIAGMIKDYFHDKEGRVGIIEGAPGSDPQIYRTQTFLEEMIRYPNIEIVGIMNGGWSRKKAAMAAYDLIAKNKDLNCIYCHDCDMAMGAWETVHEMGKDDEIMIVGIGSEPEYLDAVRTGKLYGLVSQPVEFEAAYSVSCAKRAARGEPLRSWYKNTVEIVTRENVEDYKENQFISSAY